MKEERGDTVPPKLGESYNNLYLVHQDGSYEKLTDIKEFDIGSSEPSDGPYETGGFVPYDEYKPPVIDTTDYSFELIQPKLNISPKLFYTEIIGLSRRQYRMAIRHAERMRREWLKRGMKCPLRFAMACNEILSRK